MNKCPAILLSAVLLVAGCHGASSPKKGVESFPTEFQTPKVPGVITDQKEAIEYVLTHFWDSFFNTDAPSDSLMTYGVSKESLEKSFSNYVGAMDYVDVATAQKSISSMFDKMSEAQSVKRDTTAWESICGLVEKYLYDPNSPMRNEDYYLPFVKGLSESEYTKPSMKAAYVHDAQMCSMNQFGQQVPDFRIRTLSGQEYTLYSIKAGYTMLFFSNPGCSACKEIIDQVGASSFVDPMIAAGQLAVVNVYIDDDLPAWKAYAGNYPKNWYSGYDPELIIRNDVLFSLRAIPSLYLLDADKRVIMKDAPTEKVLEYLGNIEHKR